MNSIVCALSWSALWRSASISVSAAVSIDKFTHSASSHITLSFSRAYWKWRNFVRIIVVEVSGCQAYLISCCEQIISHLLQIRSFSGVNESKHLFENFVVNVSDCDAILFSLLHLVFEHRGKYRTSCCWNMKGEMFRNCSNHLFDQEVLVVLITYF